MNHGTRRHGRTVRRPVEPRKSVRRGSPQARRPKGLIWNGSSREGTSGASR